MSTWVIISWVLVAILTAINVVVFLKLKQASEQMLKMAFPNAKNMNEALSQMQGMMGGMGGMAGKGGPTRTRGGQLGMGNRNSGVAPGAQDAQLRAAMDMLKNVKKKT
jgi:hypothetical protein